LQWHRQALTSSIRLVRAEKLLLLGSWLPPWVSDLGPLSKSRHFDEATSKSYPAAISRCDAATVNILPAKFHLEWTASLFGGRFTSWAKPNGRLAPAIMVQALPPGGKGQRTFLCFDCDRPDPLKTDKVTGWLEGELQPPK